MKKTTVSFPFTLTRPEGGGEGAEIPVEVEAEVSTDPGSLYGPPERCYPPETEVEVVRVTREGVRAMREPRRVEIDLTDEELDLVIDEAIRVEADFY